MQLFSYRCYQIMCVHQILWDHGVFKGCVVRVGYDKSSFRCLRNRCNNLFRSVNLKVSLGRKFKKYNKVISAISREYEEWSGYILFRLFETKLNKEKLRRGNLFPNLLNCKVFNSAHNVLAALFIRT